MNFKKQVLVFNLSFVLLLLAASMAFHYLPQQPEGGWKPVDILSEVRKDSSKVSVTSDDKELAKEGKLPQQAVTVKDYVTHSGLINSSGQPFALNRFNASLMALKQRKKKKVRIAYFGDSMIEGDLITQDLRNQLQQVFGGSGVGFVPVTSIVAGFRQTVIHSFSSDWRDVNFKSDDKKANDLFLSGHCFYSNGSSSVTYRPVKQARLDRFDQVDLLYGSAPEGGELVLNGKPYALETGTGIRSLAIAVPGAPEVKISMSSTSIPLYGAAFESDSGVVLDNFSFRGISGIELDVFSNALLEQIQQQRPYDLLVFQYGPNLLFRPNLTDFSWFEKKMIPVMQKIRKAFPDADMLVMSSADKSFNYGGEWHTAKGVIPLIETQYRMAQASGADFFNLYRAMGGADAMVKWVQRDTAWANKDYTHANHRGAKIFANMIFEAIMDEYHRFEAAVLPQTKENKQ